MMQTTDKLCVAPSLKFQFPKQPVLRLIFSLRNLQTVRVDFLISSFEFCEKKTSERKNHDILGLSVSKYRSCCQRCNFELVAARTCNQCQTISSNGALHPNHHFLHYEQIFFENFFDVPMHYPIRIWLGLVCCLEIALSAIQSPSPTSVFHRDVLYDNFD